MKNKIINDTALFSIGFRPFFLLAGVQAVFSVIFWVLTYHGSVTPNLPWDNYTLWHGHEMVFGFVVAIISGFLLTAIPNWTATKPIKSWWLVGIVGLWLLGRISMNFQIFSPLVTVLVDVSYLPVLILSLAPALIKAKNFANMGFLVLLSVLAIINIVIQLSVLEIIKDINPINVLFLAVHIIILIITIIGGRVIPFFTQNGLFEQNIKVEINQQPIIDKAGFVSLLILCVVGYLQNFNTPLFGVFAFITAIIHAIRLSRWNCKKALKIPILWVLHFAYAWLIIGLILEGLHATFNLIPLQLSMHAFTMGAMGTMILGMITRVSLGHTGRKIKASKLIVISYILLQFGILTRVFGGWLLPDYYMDIVIISAAFWAVTFTIFLIVYLPILVGKRLDEI